MNTEIWNDSWAIDKCWGRLETRKYNNMMANPPAEETYLEGEVVTPHGYVTVLAYTYPDRSLTRMDFIWNGRIYSRTFQKRYSKRYIVTLGRRFVEDVVGGVAESG